MSDVTEVEEHADKDTTRVGALAGRVFLRVEIYAYIALGGLLALAALIGIGSTIVSLWEALLEHGDEDTLVVTIDRLLFVLMVVEIMHTVRVSFRSGTLVCEPFLIVGLIASIRRVLVITLESSQASKPGNWTPDIAAQFQGTMLELGILGGLILVMVVSIYILRRSERIAGE
jgi:uncharacterized membrane protein (DUF373 family)